ncbi:NAD(P)-binding protein [Wolfiporia cocos MD-104 SS10]|uniref:NAD(P)-binding protein n=1 Tax=Wolfiporia cocos (strain MD-104) TaxID=742152 RepID=A0A2H3K0R8_WOLCO|nr:NAD(P)-binding protein [Wolfiporia cocos MD-104 SS10]
MSLESRVAIITGAARGIGRAVALRLAEDGFDITLNDISTGSDALDQVAQEIRAKGRRAITIIADVSNEDEVKNLVAQTVEELGRLDVMIANAGIAPPTTQLVNTDIETWDQVMSVNVRGVMLCYKHAALQMIKQGSGGRIIVITGYIVGSKFASAYCASKFAVRGLTQSLATELAGHKITVNAYAPGVILTDMTDRPAVDSLRGGSHGAATKWILGVPPDGPDAGPEVVASIVAYLVRPEAHFITGQSISVDGGIVMD